MNQTTSYLFKSLLMSAGITFMTGGLNAVAEEGSFHEFASATAQPYHMPAKPPGSGVVVPPGTVSGVLVDATDKSRDVLLRITSGPLKGSMVHGTFSSDGWVFIQINSIKTASGADVWMPETKCQDADGEVDVPRVQVDRSEWKQVQNGGMASAGSVFHIRILAPVQFDAPYDKSSERVLARN